MKSYKKVKKFLRFNHKQTFIYLFFFLLFSSLGLGYALISTTLEVDGTANVDDATWDIHFDNIQITSGSVTATTAPTIIDDTTVTFAATLENPGDFYEFTVDVVNAGTMNAKIDSLEILPDLTAEQSNYFYYNVTYADGFPVNLGDALNAGNTETLKILFKYKVLGDPSFYPAEDMNFSFSISMGYIQGTGNAIERPNNFETDSWYAVANAARYLNLSHYHVGDTKELDLGSLGTHTVRIVNMSTPDECEDPDFSQSSCGFILEFVDAIAMQSMGVSNSYDGWGATSVRSYLNGDVFDAFPDVLKGRIMGTLVAYGKGNTGTPAVEYSVDKLFLLAAKEYSGGSNNYDNADPYLRQLDYYAGKSQADFKKKYNNNYVSYWTRTADNSSYDEYEIFNDSGMRWYATVNESQGVVPAFKIQLGEISG